LHLDNPISALHEWLRVLKPGGHLDTMIPNDHSSTLSLYRVLFSRRKAKRLSFKYFDLVNALEHKNYYERLYHLISTDFFDFEFHHYPRFLGRLKLTRAYSIVRITKSFESNNLINS